MGLLETGLGACRNEFLLLHDGRSSVLDTGSIWQLPAMPLPDSWSWRVGWDESRGILLGSELT